MPRMPRRRIPTALASAALCASAVLCVAACGRDEPPRQPDTAVVAPPVVRDSVSPPPPAERVAWDEAGAGPALFVPTDTGNSTVASVVLPQRTRSTPDSALAAAAASLDGIALDLFSPAGKVGTVSVDADAGDETLDADACAPGPAVLLTTDHSVRGRWTVAFSSGHARPIAIDSLEGLAGADSAARTAEVARLASTVPGTNTGGFKGLPFAVRQARRFSDESKLDVLVAEAVRKIGQEANPREQHVLVVAERAVGATGKYDLAYHEISAGDEAEVETRDVLAAITLGADRRPTLVLNREYEDAIAYSLLQRVAPKRWRLRWTSAKLACEPAS